MKSVLSLVVPCYNEAPALPHFIHEILKIEQKLPHMRLEVWLIDDGSTDETLEVIRSYAKKHPELIYYLSFSRNFGKEAGLLAGLEHATGDYVAVMDADLQDPPHLLIDMLEILESQNYEVVATRRVTRAGEPPVRSFFARLFYKLSNQITDVHLEDGARDFRMMRREVVDAIISLPEHNRFSKGIFSWVGYRVYYLEYENVERVAGETSWSFWQLMHYAIEGIVSFSDVPLTIASWLGVIAFVGATLYGSYIIVRTLLFGATTPGWPSLAVLVVGMGGLQLLCLGIVGKYIAKIYYESKRRPHYIVQEEYLPNSKSKRPNS